MALKQRLLNFTFNLASGGSSISLSGLRASLHVEKSGALTMHQSTITIYGVSLNQANQLTTIGLNLQAGTLFHNTVTVEAGDAVDGMSIVYKGDIITAYLDLNSQPQVGLHIGCLNGAYWNLAKAQPLSLQGDKSGKQMLSDISQKMGVNFDSSALTNDTILSNTYKALPLLSQMQAIGNDAGFDVSLDDDTLVVATPGQARPGGAIAISRDTGMIGSPAIANQGIMVKTLFNPQIKRLSLVNITSIALSQEVLQRLSQINQLPATGNWYVYSLDHDLETQVPNGRWESTLWCALPGQAVASSGASPAGGG
jgi:hypothetical protein